MKKILILLSFFFLAFININAQTLNQISGRCSGTRNYSTVNIVNIGDIYYAPCSGRTSIFQGNVDFSGATITGVVSGSGTANFIPRWTASETLGNTPFSWNNTTYAFNNTALNATFLMSLLPSASGAGEFNVGSASTFLAIDDGSNAISNQVNNVNGVWNVTDASNFSLIFNANTNKITANNTTTSNTLDFDSTATGYFKVGDYTATTTDYFQQDYNTHQTLIRSTDLIRWNELTDNTSCTLSNTLGTFSCRNAGNTSSFEFNGTAESLTATFVNGITFNGGSAYIVNGDLVFLTGTTSGNVLAPSLTLGDLDNNATRLLITDSTATYRFRTGAANAVFNLTEVLNYQLQRTITTAGTVGAQTINLPAGTVNFAAGASSLVVTNSIVTANSIIIPFARTNDATCAVKNYVPAAGSFTINMTAACTAETSVGFIVTN